MFCTEQANPPRGGGAKSWVYLSNRHVDFSDFFHTIFCTSFGFGETNLFAILVRRTRTDVLDVPARVIF